MLCSRDVVGRLHWVQAAVAPYASELLAKAALAKALKSQEED